MTYVVVVLAFAVLAFGLFVVALLVVGSIRNKKEWAGASLALTDEQKAQLQDPAALGAQPPGFEGGGAETQGVAGAEYRNKTNISGSGFGI
jgi:hypothetical protein